MVSNRVTTWSGGISTCIGFNVLARSTFVSYLLTFYPSLVGTFIGFFTPMELWINSDFAISMVLVLTAPVYLVAWLLEVIRLLLFKVAVDPWKGRAFERLYKGVTDTRLYRYISQAWE